MASVHDARVLDVRGKHRAILGALESFLVMRASAFLWRGMLKLSYQKRALPLKGLERHERHNEKGP